jgi:choline/glycine/proline betaine transport protein
LIPTGFTFLWLTVFGNSAISLASQSSGYKFADIVQHNVSAALFEFFSYFPLSFIVSIIALILVVTFFVTSSDSGSLVIDMLATGGAKKSITWQRIFWSCLQGALAISLLYTGGLVSLQNMTIASAFPLTIIFLLMCFTLIKVLRKDHLRTQITKTHNSSVQYQQAHMPWEYHLKSLLVLPSQQEALSFLKDKVYPAINAVSKQLKEKEISYKVRNHKTIVYLAISQETAYDFLYSVNLLAYPTPKYIETISGAKQHDNCYYRAEVFLKSGGQRYDIMGYTKEQIIADIITQYERHLHYLHATSL